MPASKPVKKDVQANLPIRYLLCKHVFVCREGDYIFLLDLRQDKYFALGAAKARSLSEWVEGWPIQGDEGASLKAEGATLARRLLAKGILCTESAAGKQASPVSAPAAIEQLAAEDSCVHGFSGKWAPATVFVLTSLWASVQFRCYRLERLIEPIALQRRALGHEGQPFDYAHARRLLQIARKLRPFLFTSRDGCLFESFVLMKFLARYKLYPQWIFGIRARPFGAHCWIQHESTVLNDTVDHVRRLTPIMLI